MEDTVTVVSAYYRIPSKRPHNIYSDWLSLFFSLKFNLIFFSDSETIADIKRKYLNIDHVLFVEKSFDELFYWNGKYKDIWIHHNTIDPEKGRSPELYALWHEKIKFVANAIKLNPFNSSKFLWVDAGCFRSNEHICKYTKFPVYDKIPNDKMIFLNICKFKNSDYKHRNFDGNDRIGGTIYGSSISTLLKWEKIYDKMLESFIMKNKFAGDDQSIINTIYLDNPELFFLVTPEKCNDDNSDRWFYLQKYLS